MGCTQSQSQPQTESSSSTAAAASANKNTTANTSRATTESSTTKNGNSTTSNNSNNNAIKEGPSLKESPGSQSGILELHYHNHANNQIRYACQSQRGRDPDFPKKANQDSYSINIPPPPPPPPQNNNNNNGSNSNSPKQRDKCSFFGVYDGHGPYGEKCSRFVRETLPPLILKNLDSLFLFDNYQHALIQAHTECNQELRQAKHIDDANSGTTSISVIFYPNEPKITVCNVGDSRAILGTLQQQQQQTQVIMAVPLSKDHTPHLPQEAQRCKNAGARILSFGQMDPLNTASPEATDGEEEEEEDPPRVWHATGKYPGTAFTRSLGDAIAETLGVIPQPEILTLNLSPKEKVIVLASDGIFDVLSNQQVIDLCIQQHNKYHPNNGDGGDGDEDNGGDNDNNNATEDPAAQAACQAIIDMSYQEWLKNEDCLDDQDAASYDDMTVLVIFLGPPQDIPSLNNAGPNTTTTTAPQNDKDNTTMDAAQEASQVQPPHPPVQQHHGKRVRQKTLRNLEEMEGEGS